jgi:hypothetical protein
MIGIQHDLVAGATLDIGHETYAAGILFITRIIQAGFLRVAELEGGVGFDAHRSKGLICPNVVYDSSVAPSKE